MGITGPRKTWENTQITKEILCLRLSKEVQKTKERTDREAFLQLFCAL